VSISKKGFVLAGTNSGCGKTTISIGLMALLKSRGIKIATFKAGPDFIDPIFHEHVTQAPSYNLDCFMMDNATNLSLFNKHSQKKDISIVEGVMGLFDGMGHNAKGSTAELAKDLDLPVILVINCKGLYQSVLAIVKGFSELDDKLNIKGVFLNNVSSEPQYQFLKNLIEKNSHLKAIGYLPPDPEIALESRHLGLVQAEEVSDLDSKIEKIVSIFEKTVDTELLLKVATHNRTEEEYAGSNFTRLDGIKLGIAYDKAFRFYYKDNIELLEKQGAEIHYFSPLADTELPTDCNALYIGGGYPEVFANDLSKNKTLLENIKFQAESGMPIFAECGGLMYLCNAIETLNGQSHEMAGIFNCTAKMSKRLKRFGYAQLTYNKETCRCHEFHRSELIVNGNKNYQFTYKLHKPDNQRNWECGLANKNVLGGYAHIHFYSDTAFTNKIFELWKKAII